MRVRTMGMMLALAMGALFGLAGGARAQSWAESMTYSNWGGYNHFGGYYDTYGPYGGHSNYLGYVRTEASNTRGVTLITVPLQREKHRHAKRKSRARHIVATTDCGWFKRKAQETGKRKWKAEYAACRRQA